MPEPKKGTFADLYEAERRTRPRRPGRPRSKKERLQTTIYLTPEQRGLLDEMHFLWRKQFKVDRSDIAGLGLEVLHLLGEDLKISDFQDFESLKVHIRRRISMQK